MAIPDGAYPIHIRRNGQWWFPRCPSSYKVGVYTIVAEERNVDGIVRPDIVRDETFKVFLGFNVIYDYELAALLGSFAQRTGGRFVNDVQFLDPTTDSYITRPMYVGNREVDLYSTSFQGFDAERNQGLKFYRDVEFNLIGTGA